jgi:hypothetical protein
VSTDTITEDWDHLETENPVAEAYADEFQEDQAEF